MEVPLVRLPLGKDIGFPLIKCPWCKSARRFYESTNQIKTVAKTLAKIHRQTHAGNEVVR